MLPAFRPSFSPVSPYLGENRRDSRNTPGLLGQGMYTVAGLAINAGLNSVIMGSSKATGPSSEVQLRALGSFIAESAVSLGILWGILGTPIPALIAEIPTVGRLVTALTVPAAAAAPASAPPASPPSVVPQGYGGAV